MHKLSILTMLTQEFKPSNIKFIETVQSLWSGYGNITRYCIDDESVIVKTIDINTQQLEHPRGWQTDFAHQRKVSSYQNECIFYNTLAPFTNNNTRVPKCLFQYRDNDTVVLVLEDLNASGFNQRLENAHTLNIAKQVLQWLAYFHIRFLQLDSDKTSTQTISLAQQWPRGTYWHLATRPDEYNNMPDSLLKDAAQSIDDILEQAKFQTLLHGDAKIANFCFDESHQRVAAVDFQYCGKGVGVVDVMYFLGSALSNSQLTQYADELLEYYFSQIQQAFAKDTRQVNIADLIDEWRHLYCFAWADFERFLIGWSPGHKKLNAYSATQTVLAISQSQPKQ